MQTTNSVRFISNNVPLIISREQYSDGKYLRISVCVIKNDQNNCTLRRHFHRKNNNAEEKKKPARQRLVFLDFYFKIKIHIFWKVKFFRHNGYYEVLGLPSESAAKISDIKHAYLRIAMKHHPDKAGADNVESKEIFEEASEAYRYKKFMKWIVLIDFLMDSFFLNIITLSSYYRTLMDPNQRYYYDRHGYPEMELRQGVPSIFDWEPR